MPPKKGKFSKKRTGYRTKNNTKPQAVVIKKDIKKSTVKTGVYHNMEYAKLKYMDNSDLVSALVKNNTGTIVGYNINAITSPNINQTVGDKLPRGFASYLNVFGRYKVRGAMIKIEIAPNTTGKSLQVVIGLNNTQDLATNIYPVANVPLDFNSMDQRRNIWTYPLPTDKKFVFKKYIQIPYLNAVTKTQFNSDIAYFSANMTNVVGASNWLPTARSDIRMTIVNNTDATTATIPYEIEILYYTEFYQRTRDPTINSA